MVIEMNKIHQGDCIEVMKTLPENSVDAIVTDPPYGLEFMGKKWDYDVPSVELWTEVLRVLKEGGYLLSFAGTRTQHRMAVNIEDAGFEIRDMIAWVYGSGFPKSHNIGKAIDKNNGKYKIDLTDFGNYIKEKREVKRYSRKQLDDIMETCTAVSWWEGRKTGVQLPSKKMYKKLKKVLDLDNKFDDLIDWAEAERKVIGKKKTPDGKDFDARQPKGWANAGFDGIGKTYGSVHITAPTTEEAKQWEGWGTALKPALEPITMARKPFKGTVANNVLKNGVGGINIDGCRVGTTTETHSKSKESAKGSGIFGEYGEVKTEIKNYGRFPANIILDEEAGKMLDEQSGIVKSGEPKMRKSLVGFGQGNVFGSGSIGNRPNGEYGDKGGASRFFYCAKANKKERNKGCEGISKKPRSTANKMMGQSGEMKTGSGKDRTTDFHNNHPTVKPIKLMQYLVRLVTPKGGIVLDPFLGSGTTAIACLKLNRKFIGIEKEEEYVKIAKARIKPFLEQETLPEVFMEDKK